MSESGSPYMRFRRALDGGSVVEALSAAAELGQLGLADALELVLLLGGEGDPGQFRRAALRWHGLYVRAAGDVDPAEAQAVLGLVAMLAGDRRAAASRALAELLDRRSLLPACEALLRRSEDDGPRAR